MNSENKQPEEEEELFYTPEELSKRLKGHVSVRTLKNWRNEGKGPKFKYIGNKPVYPKNSVEHWINSDWQQKSSTTKT